MRTLIFPGQGSQSVGMASEFYNNFNSVKKIFSLADEILKYKISKTILEGPEETLKLTENAQPAIMLVSYSIIHVIKSEFGINLKCKYLAGHSLGEYSALVCANSLSFEDALLLLQKRGKFMQEAVPVGQGSMLAVLGCEIKKLNEIISNLKEDGVCEIANDNADGQVIISGHSEKIKKLQSFLKINKIKSIALPVSAPFHCSLMKQASEKMKSEIESTFFGKPQIDIINNVTASIETSPVNIKDLLIRQIFSPVKWRETILKMEKDGITDFIEIGPGKVLSGLVKRIIKNALTININSVEDIKKFLK